jgi:hypothetical protein
VNGEQLVRVIADSKGRGTCRSCQAPITWYRTHPNGKALPFDGDPVPRKSEHATTGAGAPLILFLSADDSHWVRCPQAKEWKRS